MDDIMAGRAPNAGRLCGYCYHPLGKDRNLCPHCERSVTERPPAERVADPVIAMYRAGLSREALAVRGIAWGGLTIGVVVALLPVAFVGAAWWTIAALFGIMAFFYIASANLANSLGDAIGFRWGQSLLSRRWRRFVDERDGDAGPV
jgi:hypothetical protein